MNEQKVFEYLDALRESNVTNMMGAAPYVQEEFGLSIREARDLVLKWMESFNENK